MQVSFNSGCRCQKSILGNPFHVSTGPRVEVSENVVGDNLHFGRPLVTVYYVTDIRQTADFAWLRDTSGIRINVAVQNVNVAPVYSDDADGDDGGDVEYMTSRPDATRIELDRFRNIVSNHCRSIFYLLIFLIVPQGR